MIQKFGDRGSERAVQLSAYKLAYELHARLNARSEMHHEPIMRSARAYSSEYDRKLFSPTA